MGAVASRSAWLVVLALAGVLLAFTLPLSGSVVQRRWSWTIGAVAAGCCFLSVVRPPVAVSTCLV